MTTEGALRPLEQDGRDSSPVQVWVRDERARNKLRMAHAATGRPMADLASEALSGYADQILRDAGLVNAVA